MKRILLAAILVSLCVSLGVLSGCGSGSGVAVTITSAGGQTTLQEGQSVVITATVTNATNTGVTFSLSGCTTNCGSLSSTSTSPTTYTAPSGASVTTSFTVKVVATPAADPTKAASITLTINPVGVTASAANNQTTLEQGQSVAITATVTNASNTGVTFSLSGCTTNCGSLSSTSTNPTTYTAPAVVAANFTVTVTATSAADGSKSGSVTLTITPPISVSITNKITTIQAATSAVTLNATVTNDQNAQGVTWAIAASCTSSCGSLSNATALSVMYTPPQDPPTPPTVTITATSKADNTKSDSDPFTVTAHPIVVTITNKITTIVAGAAAVTFNATVAHDLANKGVTWTLIANSVPCTASTCGALSNATASSVTYTPPASAPASPNNTPTLTATSVADVTKNDSDTFTITAAPPISITFTQAPPSSLAVNGTAMVSATVTNDSMTKGVDWSVTCGSSGCGSFSATHTASGTATTYTAPASVPAGNTVTITATSTADSGKSVMAIITITAASAACPSGSETFLNGQYAILLRGFDSSGPVGIGATFDADGAGHIAKLVGLEDINSSGSSGVQNLSITSGSSSYSVGSDHRGCLTIVNSAGTTQKFRFSLGAISSGVASNGHIIEFDNTGSNTAGVLRKQDLTAFSNAQISGNYAFGVSGPDVGGGKFAAVGMVSLNGGGGFNSSPASVVDFNDKGSVDGNSTTYPASPVSLSQGSYSISASGRGILSFLPAGGGSSSMVHTILYVVSSSELFILSSDSQSTNNLFVGPVLQQSGSFTGSSLNAKSILYTTGLGNSSGSTDSRISAGILTPNGVSSFSFSGQQNDGGMISPQSVPLGSITYSVALNGRVTFSGGGGSTPIIYLVSANKGFVLFTDSSTTNAHVASGFLEPQSGSAFTVLSANGTYAFGAFQPETSSVSDQAGVANFDGIGNITGTSDDNSSGSLTPNSAFTNTYSIDTTGLGVIPANCTIGTNCDNIFFVISPTKAVLLKTKASSTNPNLSIAEQ
jgi:hypothetical protein